MRRSRSPRPPTMIGSNPGSNHEDHMAEQELDISDIPEAVVIAAFTLTERIEDFLIDDVLADAAKADAAYQQSARILHPDAGGSDREFIALQDSRDALRRWHESGQTGL